VITSVMPTFNLSLNTIHFDKKLANGGIPARFATVSRMIHFSFIEVIVFMFFVFILFITVVRIATEGQYSTMKMKKDFMFRMTLASIHLRLKTEDRAMISMKLSLDIWDKEPQKAERTIKGKISFFH